MQKYPLQVDLNEYYCNAIFFSKISQFHQGNGGIVSRKFDNLCKCLENNPY
jgi:hypothetical protein